MDLDVDALLRVLGNQIGQQAVQITALQLQLDAERLRVTELEGGITPSGDSPAADTAHAG